MLRIYCRDGKFGFTDPCKYNSVVELIDYFQRHSLAAFNKALDITLTHPLSKHTTQVRLPFG